MTQKQNQDRVKIKFNLRLLCIILFYRLSNSQSFKTLSKMPCSVPSCKEKRDEKKSTFSIPKDVKLLCLWENSLGFKLKRTSRICELHFKPEDVIKTWVSGKGVNTYTVSFVIIRIQIYYNIRSYIKIINTILN